MYLYFLHLRYFIYYFFIIFVFWTQQKFFHIFLAQQNKLLWNARHSLSGEIQKIVVRLDMRSCPEPIYSSEWKSYYMIQLQEPTWFPSQRTCHQRQLWSIYCSVQKYWAGFSCSIYWKPGKIILIFFQEEEQC